MKKAQSFRWFISGMLTAALAACLVSSSLAALSPKMIEVYTGVDIYVDDVKLDPQDAKGDPVEAFVYNGTTYLPVRAVGEAVGKTVQWEGKTNSVYLGKHTGDKPAVWLKDLDYFEGHGWSTTENSTWADSEVKDNLGKVRSNAISGDISNTYKINGQYSKITGTLFSNYRSRDNSYKYHFKIYGDGELLYSADMAGGIEPIDFSVDLTGVLELKVVLDGSWTTFGYYYAVAIADCGLWT